MAKLEFLDATSPNNQVRLKELDRKLSNFYNSEKAKDYWLNADDINNTWKPDTHPYHLHLKNFIKNGDSIVELGCGSAHAYRNLRELGVKYTGVEWAESQVQTNKDNYPSADFIPSSVYSTSLPSGTFDVAISLFTLEHLVYPHKYLQEMYRLVKLNGIIAIICPDFRRSGGMNSFVCGTSSLDFRDKLRTGRLWDALIHLYERKFLFPKIIREQYNTTQKDKKFLIYPNPKCFDGRYYSDTDAVYFVGQQEVQDFVEDMNCKIIATPSNVQDDRFSFCYVVATKES